MGDFAFFLPKNNMTAEVAKKAVTLGLLEEDDVFEEFPTKELVCKTNEEDVNVWEDNWDDDAVEDDFSVQLSTFCRKRAHSSSHSPPLRSPEPIAKKICSRKTPPPSPISESRRSMNGRRNGHSNNGNGASHQPEQVEEIEVDPVSPASNNSRQSQPQDDNSESNTSRRTSRR